MDDKTLQRAVAEELEWAPHVDAAHIHVTVHDGVVQLSGYVGTLAEKKAANRNVWHLHGVLGVRDDIAVRQIEAHQHPDEEVARRVRQVLLWDSLIPGARIAVRVTNGVVILTGTLERAHQRLEAEQRVQVLAGVVGVDNQIVVCPPADIEDELPNKVRHALARHSEIDASGIVVDVQGSQVTLSGTVPSYAQLRIAENAAWAAPGVTNVVDRMRVGR